MSVQWWLHTNTRRSKEEILSFLARLPGAGRSSEFPDSSEDVVEYNGHALAGLYIPSRGSAESAMKVYGFLTTITVVFNYVRGADRTGFRETIYRVASAFAGWDDACDMRFSQDDSGIFVRRGGYLLINPRQFDTPLLRGLLPAKFATADPPEDDLQKAGWPPIS